MPIDDEAYLVFGVIKRKLLRAFVLRKKKKILDSIVCAAVGVRTTRPGNIVIIIMSLVNKSMSVHDRRTWCRRGQILRRRRCIIEDELDANVKSEKKKTQSFYPVNLPRPVVELTGK